MMVVAVREIKRRSVNLWRCIESLGILPLPPIEKYILLTPPPSLSSLTTQQYNTTNPHVMPSRGNPNVPNKSRRVASRRKVQKKNAVNKVTKNPRGTAKSSVLHPTSGPLAPVSGKKARKLEKAQNHARQRAIERGMAEAGEVSMTDAPTATKKKVSKAEQDEMDIDTID